MREDRLEYTFRWPMLIVIYLTGKSCVKSMERAYDPPSHGESFGPGISQCHLSILVVPSGFSMGLATKPKGWSLLHYFRSFLSRLITSSLISFFSINCYYNSIYDIPINLNGGKPQFLCRL